MNTSFFAHMVRSGGLRYRRGLPRRRAAFSLVELLVVVAVIGILAALLMPSLRKSMIVAKSIGCTNILRQQGAGVMMYATDNRNMMPLFCYSPAVTTSAYTYVDADKSTRAFELYWGALIWPYVNDAKVFHCPADPATNASGTQFRNNYGINTGQGSTLDDYSGAVQPGNTLNKGNRLSQIVRPSLLILIGDRAPDKESPVFKAWGAEIYRYQVTSEDYTRFFAHDIGFNMVFVDGHAQWRHPFEMRETKYWYRRGY